MPSPKNFKNTAEGYKKYMGVCMHQVHHMERKKKEQSIAQCLNVWRKIHGPKHSGKPKKAMVTDILRKIAGDVGVPIAPHLDRVASEINHDQLEKMLKEGKIPAPGTVLKGKMGEFDFTLTLNKGDWININEYGDISIDNKDLSSSGNKSYHIASEAITARLDHIASELEKVDPRLALALDHISDKLDRKDGKDVIKTEEVPK